MLETQYSASNLDWRFVSYMILYMFQEGWYGEGGSGLGTRVHPWRIHVDAWQNQYDIVK